MTEKNGPNRLYKSPSGVWVPFGLWRIDWYYCKFYLRAFALIICAIGALIAIGDVFQRFDEFVLLARRENQDLYASVMLFLTYYASWVPQLIFQYMLPVIMLLAAAITATSSFAGPRGNNEYIVIRSAGIPVLRAFVPLILPAVLVALLFQATRDLYLPEMVRGSSAVYNRLRSRTSNPTSVTVFEGESMQTAAIGWFSPDGVAHNIILEVRPAAAFQRGDAAAGDNDFVAYRAATAFLAQAPEGGYYWIPGDKAEVHAYSLYARRSTPWAEPVATSMTPAMLERQTLGDAVSSWRDLFLMRRDNAGARFEMHWRLADPLACCLLIIWGAGLCMGRMLRGAAGGYISSISVSMLAAAAFYILRLTGRSLWEAGILGPWEGVWLPLAVAALVAAPIALLMER